MNKLLLTEDIFSLMNTLLTWYERIIAWNWTRQTAKFSVHVQLIWDWIEMQVWKFSLKIFKPVEKKNQFNYIPLIKIMEKKWTYSH